MPIRCQPLFSSAALSVNYYPGSSTELVYVFGSIGENRDIRRDLPGRDEFVGYASGSGARHVVVIKDHFRTWFTHPEIDQTWQIIAKAARGIIQPSRISTLGLSMGGFAAVKYAQRLEAEIAIAFSPQISIAPSVVKDRRWERFLERATLSTGATISAEDLGACRYWALFGGQSTRDIRHAQRFMALPRVEVLKSQRGYHNFPAVMKEQGQLRPLIDHLLDPAKQPDLTAFGMTPYQL